MSLRKVAGIIYRSAPWRKGHSSLLIRQVWNRRRNMTAAFTDYDHLRAAAEWLARAQDVRPGGGICGRYLLPNGWSSSYPETTGYLVPTLIVLGSRIGIEGFCDRASRSVNFLLSMQLPNGAFPGGEVHQNTAIPSVFNTAQIIHGLIAFYAATGETRTLTAALRAADWLVSVQDADGAWRKHVYQDVATTYTAHASCWLAELGRQVGSEVYLGAARKHLNWILRHVDHSSGWFDLAGFTTEDHRERVALTHTISYTLWGALLISEIIDHDEGRQTVERASLAIARKLDIWGWLPGVLDAHWERRADFACLTGNAQMALVWFRLYEKGGDMRFLNAALKAIDLVKIAQPMEDTSVDIRGGIPGSDPIWGDYIKLGLPNWAAKFFIDALLEKARILGTLEPRPRSERQQSGTPRGSAKTDQERAVPHP